MSATSHDGQFLLDVLPSYANFNPDLEKKMQPPHSYQKIWLNYIGETNLGDYGQENEFYLYAENASGPSIECKGE